MPSTPSKPAPKPQSAESPCETVISEGEDSSSDTGSDKMMHDEKVSLFSTVSLNYAFSISMALVGAVDILATVLPAYVAGSFTNSEEILSGNPVDADGTPSDLPAEFLEVVKWLDHHNITISFTFFALWFANAFFDANVLRNQALIKAERKRLYSKDPKYQQKPKFWKTPTFVYMRTILLQLMTLPVGFYFILYMEILRASHGESMEDIEHMEEEVVVAFTDLDDVVQYETFSAHNKRAVLFAIIRHFWLQFSGTTVRIAKSNLMYYLRTAGPKAARKILGKAIRNPLKFRRRVRKLLTTIRWLKYIAPLIGTCNKLNGNLQDLYKKRRQRIEAEKQKRVRQRLFEKKPLKLKQEDAAKIIQSAFRAYYARKATRALLAFKLDKEYFAVLKVQRQFRRKLAEARVRLQKKQEELKRLETIRNKNVKSLSDDDKKRMYELQDELGQEAKALLNRRLLLRPNTAFAVVWKYLFVFCVIFEISNLAIRPWLKDIKSKRTGDEIGMDEFFADHVVPRKVSELPSCEEYRTKLAKLGSSDPLFCKGNCQLKQYQKRKEQFAELKATQPWYCKEPAASVQEGLVDVIALLIVPSQVSEWPDCQVPEEKSRRWKRNRHPTEKKAASWYCTEPYAELHSRYRSVVDFFLEEFLVFVGVICFLDVFITFFTGEIHPENGILVPKPFFVRWILPGLLLQLLVNPQVGEVSKVVWRGWQYLVKQGPIRVYRWNIAVIFPVLYLSWSFFMEWVWMPLVHHENTFKILVA